MWHGYIVKVLGAKQYINELPLHAISTVKALCVLSRYKVGYHTLLHRRFELLTRLGVSDSIMYKRYSLSGTISKYVTPVDVRSCVTKQIIILKKYITIGDFWKKRLIAFSKNDNRIWRHVLHHTSVNTGNPHLFICNHI